MTRIVWGGGLYLFAFFRSRRTSSRLTPRSRTAPARSRFPSSSTSRCGPDHTHRHTQTHTQTLTHTDTDTDRHTDTQTHTDTHRHTQTHTGIHTHTDAHTKCVPHLCRAVFLTLAVPWLTTRPESNGIVHHLPGTDARFGADHKLHTGC